MIGLFYFIVSVVGAFSLWMLGSDYFGMRADIKKLKAEATTLSDAIEALDDEIYELQNVKSTESKILHG